MHEHDACAQHECHGCTSVCSAPGYVAYQIVAAILCTACMSLYGCICCGHLHKLQESHPAMAPVFLALGAAIPGTQTLISTKALSMMMVVSVGRQNQLTHWFFWVSALTPFATASVWTAAMQHGLSSYPSIIMLPLLQVMYTSVGVFTGVVFFQEYRQMSAVAIGMYVVGFLGMFSGIGLSISPDALTAGLQEMKDKAAAHCSHAGASDTGVLPSALGVESNHWCMLSSLGPSPCLSTHSSLARAAKLSARVRALCA